MDLDRSFAEAKRLGKPVRGKKGGCELRNLIVNINSMNYYVVKSVFSIRLSLANRDLSVRQGMQFEMTRLLLLAWLEILQMNLHY